jgi:hypothetical protein
MNEFVEARDYIEHNFIATSHLDVDGITNYLNTLPLELKDDLLRYFIGALYRMWQETH